MLTKDSISFAYNNAAEFILEFGRSVAPRGLETKEMKGPSYLTTDGYCTPFREGMSTKLAAMEALMIVAGEFDLNYIAAVAPNTDLRLWEKQSDYGPRLSEQVHNIREMLRLEPTTRRAIAYLNSPDTPSEDLACSSSIQWLVRGAELETFVTFRSWDLVYGFPVDILTHSYLSQCLALSLGLVVGPVTFATPTLHIYNSTAHLAKSIGAVKFWLSDYHYGSPWSEFQERASDFAYEYSRNPKGYPKGIQIAKLPDRTIRDD